MGVLEGKVQNMDPWSMDPLRGPGPCFVLSHRKWRKVVRFLFAGKDQRGNIYQCTLDIL